MSSVITSIAAMLVVCFLLFRNMPDGSAPGNLGNVASFKRYTAYSEITTLIETEDYTSALAYIEKAERVSANTDASTENQVLANNDSISKNLYELKWLKVLALVGLDRTDEAKSLLKEIKNIEGEFHDDIDSLLNNLQITKGN